MARGWWILVLALAACADVDPDSLVAPTDGRDSITKIINGRFTQERPEVGLLQWNGGSCTATLIRDNVAITAGHCVGWSTNDGQGRPLGSFIVHDLQGRGTQFAFDAHISYGQDFNQGGDTPTDIALVRLTQRVPANLATPAPVANRRPNAGEQVTLFGYGCGDRQNTGDANQGRKQKLQFAQGRTTNLCPGDSGGPTFLGDGGLFQVNSAYDGAGTDLFGDVVGMAARIEQQASAWAGNAGAPPQQQAPQGPGLDCEGIYLCLQGCAGDVACQQDCAARTGVDARRRYDALVACSQANQCGTSECLQQRCGGPLQACVGGAQQDPQPQPDPQPGPQPDPQIPGGDLSCLDLLGCGQQCAGDAGCFQACLDQADPVGRQQYQAYADCFVRNGCQDGACAGMFCQAEFDACSGNPAPRQDVPPGGAPPEQAPPGNPGGCESIVQCMDGCGFNDQACLQNCFFQGDQPAQIAFGALAACAAVNQCADEGCVAQRCPREFAMCFDGQAFGPGGGCPNGGQGFGGGCPNNGGGEWGGGCPNDVAAGGAQCAEIIACFGRCGDGACADRCYAQGSDPGRRAVDAIYRCAEAQGCSDFGCVEARCGAEIGACF